MPDDEEPRHKIPDVASDYEKILRFLSRPGYAVRNLLTGNPGGAARQIIDQATDVLSAPLPKALSIPNTATEEDFPEASDLVGGMEPGWGKTSVDILGGMATDPLSYLSFGKTGGVRAGLPFTHGTEILPTKKPVDPLSLIGRHGDAAITKGAALADEGLAKAFPRPRTTLKAGTPISDAYRSGKRAIKETLGWHDLTPGQRAALSDVRGEGGTATRAAVDRAKAVMSGLSEVEDQTLAEAFEGLDRQKMIPHPMKGVAVPDLVPGDLLQRTEELARRRGLDTGKLKTKAQEMSDLMQGWVAESEKAGSPVKNWGAEYLMRNWEQEDHLPSPLGTHGGTPNVGKKRVLNSPQEVQDFLAEGNNMEWSATRRLVTRGSKQGGVMQRAAAAKLSQDTVEDIEGAKRTTANLGASTLDAELTATMAKVPTIPVIKVQNVPYGMGLDTTGTKIYHDPEFKHEVRSVDGRKINSREATMVHEITERRWMDQGYSYDEAHDIANAIESHYLRKQNFTPGEITHYEEMLRPELRASRKWSGAPPADLEQKPYQAENEGWLLVDPAHRPPTVSGAEGQKLRPTVSTIDSPSVKSYLEEIQKIHPDFAQQLNVLYSGLPERGSLGKFLAGANRYFKQAAVAGVVIPRIGSILRNSLGGVPQAAAEHGASPLSALQRQPEILYGALSDAIEKVGGSALDKGDLTKYLKEIDTAFASGDGTIEGLMRGLKDPVLQGALQHGVLDGFISTETAIRDLVGPRSRWRDWFDMPSSAFQGVEQRLRLSQYLDLVKAGTPPAEAAHLAKAAFLDYSVSSGKNRMLRDVIPFAQFMGQSIPQQAGWLSRIPAAAIGFQPLFAQNEENLTYPFMQGKVNIPMGRDEEDNPQYLTGLELPVEALAAIPTSGTSFRKSVISQAHPILKTAYSEVTGSDPYFGTTFGSYATNPKVLQALGAGKESEFARQYNLLAGSGMIQPVASVVQQLGTLTDPSKSTLTAVGDFLSPGRIQSVDEDRAIQQILEDEAVENPRIKKHLSLYQTGDNPEIEGLLTALRAAKSKNRTKAKARLEAASADVVSTPLP